MVYVFFAVDVFTGFFLLLRYRDSCGGVVGATGQTLTFGLSSAHLAGVSFFFLQGLKL